MNSSSTRHTAKLVLLTASNNLAATLQRPPSAREIAAFLATCGISGTVLEDAERLLAADWLRNPSMRDG